MNKRIRDQDSVGNNENFNDFGILRTLMIVRFLTETDPESSVAGINLQGYNGFLHNVKQLRWRV
jgi:hypothetical protein